jgi:hypothetical protein
MPVYHRHQDRVRTSNVGTARCLTLHRCMLNGVEHFFIVRYYGDKRCLPRTCATHCVAEQTLVFWPVHEASRRALHSHVLTEACCSGRNFGGRLRLALPRVSRLQVGRDR